MRKFVVIGLGLVFLLAGCQQVVNVPEESIETSLSEENESVAEASLEEAEEAVEENDDMNQTLGDEKKIIEGQEIEREDGVFFVYEDMSLRIPDKWKDKYVVVSIEGGFQFLQKASYEKDQDLGILITFYKENNDSSIQYEGVYAYTQDYVYQAFLPGDACYYDADQMIVEQYYEMQEQVKELCDSLVIDANDVTYTRK